VKATSFVVKELPYFFEGGAFLWLVERYLAEQGRVDLLKGRRPYNHKGSGSSREAWHLCYSLANLFSPEEEGVEDATSDYLTDGDGGCTHAG
jgi:hypothetical protein